MRRDDPRFDTAGFVRAYAVLGAQRATKIMGIFARLDLRDGKPHYLGHLPRVRILLKKSLRHPALAELKACVSKPTSRDLRFSRLTTLVFPQQPWFSPPPRHENAAVD